MGKILFMCKKHCFQHFSCQYTWYTMPSFAKTLPYPVFILNINNTVRKDVGLFEFSIQPFKYLLLFFLCQAQHFNHSGLWFKRACRWWFWLISKLFVSYLLIHQFTAKIISKEDKQTRQKFSFVEFYLKFKFLIFFLSVQWT